MKFFLLFLFLLPVSSISQTLLGFGINGQNPFETFGTSVSSSFDGLTIVAGAPYISQGDVGPSTVRVYNINSSGDWLQVGQDIDGEVIGDQFGVSVSISNDGNIFAAGAIRNDDVANDSGHVRIFENQNGSWVQLGQDIDGNSVDDLLGSSVSLSSDGTLVAIGAVQNVNEPGKVKIFEYQSTTSSWQQVGQDLIGEAIGDRFGTTVSLSDNGSIVAVGGNLNDSNGADSGHVRIYENLSGTWLQLGQDIDGDAAGDASGQVSLSANGNILAIGANGYVRVYENQNDTWVKIGQNIVDPGSGTVSISHNGNFLAIGNPTTANVGPLNINGVSVGYVRTYQNNNGTWERISDENFGGYDNTSSLGRSLSISGDGNYVATGALASNNTGIFNNSFIGEVLNFFTSGTGETLSINTSSDNTFNIVTNSIEKRLEITLSDTTQILEQVNLYSINGQFLYSGDNLTIDTIGLSSGIYIVEVKTNKGKSAKKVILE